MLARWLTGHAGNLTTPLLMFILWMGAGPPFTSWSCVGLCAESAKPAQEEERLRHSVASALNALGAFLYQSNRIGEAEARFREALQYAPDEMGVRKNLAMVLFGQSRFQEVRDLYPGSEAAEISDPSLLTALAISCYAVGDYEDAIPYFEELSARGNMKAELQLMSAVAYDLSGAAAKSKEVLGGLGNSPEVDAGYHVFKGDAVRDRGRVQEAIAEYERALAIRADLPAVPYRLGVLYSDTHQYEKSLQAFERELSINPTNSDAAYSIGAYYLIWGQDFEKAKEYFQKAVASNATNVGGYLGLMKVYLAWEKADDALSVCQEAENRKLAHPELYYLKARALRLKGELDLAEGALQRFEELKAADEAEGGTKR